MACPQCQTPINLLAENGTFRNASLVGRSSFPSQLRLSHHIKTSHPKVRNSVSSGPPPSKHQTCFSVGSIYFTVMAFRLIAGLAFMAECAGFAKSIPALFHIIL